jgi:hypothetical protein
VFAKTALVGVGRCSPKTVRRSRAEPNQTRARRGPRRYGKACARCHPARSSAQITKTIRRLLAGSSRLLRSRLALRPTFAWSQCRLPPRMSASEQTACQQQEHHGRCRGAGVLADLLTGLGQTPASRAVLPGSSILWNSFCAGALWPLPRPRWPPSPTASVRPRHFVLVCRGPACGRCLCPMTYALAHETTDAETNTARAAGRLADEETPGSLAQDAPGQKVEGQRPA